MSGEYKGKIMTVLGPIAPGEIGVTQMHEHMIIDFLAVSGSAQQSHQMAFADGASEQATAKRRGHGAVRAPGFRKGGADKIEED